MIFTFKSIISEQKAPLDHKIEAAKSAILRGFNSSRSRAALAFSGGKDSTVLWHLIKTYFPDKARNMAVIFGNTGVEFPESLRFARKIGKEWGADNFYEATPERLKHDELKYAAQVQVLKYLIDSRQVGKILKADGKLKTTQTLNRTCPPDMLERFKHEKLIWKAGTIKSYWWCVDQYGYPIFGKAASKLKARRINIDCFLRFSKSASESDKLKQYYNILRKVKFSQACCDVLKKEPSERIQAQLKIDLIFKGLMAAESHTRKVNFATRGYVFESRRNYIDTPFYHCNPLAIWTDDDIWEYIRRYNVPYSPLYDITYDDKDGNECKIKRNGCIGCYTDFGRKNSHMFVLRQTHPGLWKAVMKYGMANEIQKLRTARSQPGLFDEHVAWAIENRQCAFD